ncbi:MAG: hypothetical protein HYY17_03525 [Planctomycetes bacterium]|nr:hypothetical protein [Planctomycetota bacterium]
MVDAKWVESLKRLAAANARAHRERLRALTLEEGLRRFEEHCLTLHAGFPSAPAHRTHPVGLVKYWKLP